MTPLDAGIVEEADIEPDHCGLESWTSFNVGPEDHTGQQGGSMTSGQALG
jgi:hypothetical protein